MSMPTPQAGAVVSSRFIKEDLRSLASYLEAAIEAFGEISFLLARLDAGATGACDEALAVLNRVKWHLAALPESKQRGADLIAADQKAFTVKRRASTFVKPRGAIAPDALEAALRSSVPEAEFLCVENVSLLRGGRSKLMAVVTQSGCDTLPPRFVFRQDWASAVTGTSVKVEYALLDEINRAGVQTPAPLHFCAGDASSGGAFMLMTLARGRAVGDLFKPPFSQSLAIALATQLGRLHSLPTEGFARIPDVEMRDYSASQLRSRLSRFESANKALGLKCPVVAEALDRLAATISGDEGPLRLIHGDLGFHNLLIEEDRLMAILDWEFAHLGHPAEDLGYIRMDVEQMMDWTTFLNVYRASGGPEVSGTSIDFYQLWGMVRLYCLLLQARAALRAGLVRDVGVARMCAEWMPQLIETLCTALRRPVAA